jgi:hypothetical protein
MLSRSIFTYFWFGTCVRYLESVGKGEVIFCENDDGRIKSNIEMFFENLDKLGLLVTKRASYKLVEFKEKVVDKAKLNQELTSDEADELQKHMTELRHTLQAELMGMEAYITQSKLHDISILINDISKLFAPKVFQKLPEIARYDLQEAGRCIAFERSTAAAFHILRGTESVLKSFYFAIVKRKRIKKFMWGPMIIDLTSRKKAKDYKIIIDHLDNIRKSFRNPTQHPEKIYDIHEVQNLLSLCIDSINRMAKVL